MKELDEIDQLFQTTFEGFELTPDPSVKAHIDRALASKKKRRRFLLILFPAFLSLGVVAAIFYFQAVSSEKTTHNPQLTQNTPSQIHPSKTNDIDKRKEVNTPSFADQSEKAPSIHYLHSKKETSGRKNTLLRPDFSGLSGKKSRVNSHARVEKDFSENRRNSAILRPDRSKTNLNLSMVTDTTSPQISTLSGQAKNQADPEENRELAEANKQDSTATVNDSTNTENLTTTSLPVHKPSKVVTKTHRLSLLTGWEGEKKQPFEAFDTTGFQGKRREFATVHSSSFYGKLEFHSIINARTDILFGLGFRSSQIKQYGSLYERDSVIVHEGVSSTPSDSIVYFINHRTGTQTYQVNSITVPLGIAYSIPIGNVFRFRISGGTELTYGWMTKKQSSPGFSAPKFRPFGWNIWLRSEFHYTFGRFQLFAFGSFNQALNRQLKWDFTTRRTPAFGAGVGLLIGF